MSAEAPAAAPVRAAIVAARGPEVSFGPSMMSFEGPAINGGSAGPNISLRSIMDLPVYRPPASFNPDRTVPVPEVVFNSKLFSKIEGPKEPSVSLASLREGPTNLVSDEQSVNLRSLPNGEEHNVGSPAIQSDRPVADPLSVLRDKLFTTIAKPKEPARETPVVSLLEESKGIGSDMATEAFDPSLSDEHASVTSAGLSPDMLPEQPQSGSGAFGGQQLESIFAENPQAHTELSPVNSFVKEFQSFDWDGSVDYESAKADGLPTSLQLQEVDADSQLASEAISDALHLFEDNPQVSAIFSTAFENALLEKIGDGCEHLESAATSVAAISEESEVYEPDAVLVQIDGEDGNRVKVETGLAKENDESLTQTKREDPIWNAFETKTEEGKPQDIAYARSRIAHDINTQVAGSDDPIATARMAIGQLDKVEPLFSVLKREVMIEPIADAVEVELASSDKNDEASVVRVVDLAVNSDASKEIVFDYRFKETKRESALEEDQLKLARSGAVAMVNVSSRYWRAVGSRPQNQPQELERVG